MRDYNSIQTRYSFKRINYLLTDFHPAKRPVLWRILITQAHIYRSIVESAKDPSETRPQLRLDEDYPQNIKERIKRSIPEKDREDFDWRSEDEVKTIDKKAIYSHFNAAEAYLFDVLSAKHGEYKHDY